MDRAPLNEIVLEGQISFILNIIVDCFDSKAFFHTTYKLIHILLLLIESYGEFLVRMSKITASNTNLKISWSLYNDNVRLKIGKNEKISYHKIHTLTHILYIFAAFLNGAWQGFPLPCVLKVADRMSLHKSYKT